MNKKSDILERLYSVIESRKGGDPKTSYTAKLLAQGMPEIARKVGEEAIETITAALTEEKNHIVEESADLLYHLLILWVQKGVTPEEVWTELVSREGISGNEEKASRTTD